MFTSIRVSFSNVISNLVDGLFSHCSNRVPDFAIRELAFDPDLEELLLEQIAHANGQLGDGVHLPSSRQAAIVRLPAVAFGPIGRFLSSRQAARPRSARLVSRARVDTRSPGRAGRETARRTIVARSQLI